MNGLSVAELRDWCRANNKAFHLDADGIMSTMNESGTAITRHTVETLAETVLGAQSDPQACITGLPVRTLPAPPATVAEFLSRESSLAQMKALNAEAYVSLVMVLKRALAQAAFGKGAERHAQALPFDMQPMQRLIDLYGPGFALGQAAKKMQESQRLPRERAVAELLGAIVYAAGAVIAMEKAPVPPAAALAANDNVPVTLAATWN